MRDAPPPQAGVGERFSPLKIEPPAFAAAPNPIVHIGIMNPSSLDY